MEREQALSISSKLADHFEDAHTSTPWDIWVPLENLPEALRFVKQQTPKAYNPEVYPLSEDADTSDPDGRVCIHLH